jgi:hypothetical protein
LIDLPVVLLALFLLHFPAVARRLYALGIHRLLAIGASER